MTIRLLPRETRAYRRFRAWSASSSTSSGVVAVRPLAGLPRSCSSQPRYLRPSGTYNERIGIVTHRAGSLITKPLQHLLGVRFTLEIELRLLATDLNILGAQLAPTADHWSGRGYTSC